MIYVVLGIVVLIVAFAACRHLASRVHLADNDLLEARELLEDLRADEIDHLKEENAVMRNLLLDFVENEASLANISCPMERSLRGRSRIARRRELFGEAVVFLDKSAAPTIKIPQSAI